MKMIIGDLNYSECVTYFGLNNFRWSFEREIIIIEGSDLNEFDCGINGLASSVSDGSTSGESLLQKKNPFQLILILMMHTIETLKVKCLKTFDYGA